MLKSSSSIDILRDLKTNIYLRKNKSSNDLHNFNSIIINDDDNWSMSYYFE